MATEELKAKRFIFLLLSKYRKSVFYEREERGSERIPRARVALCPRCCSVKFLNIMAPNFEFDLKFRKAWREPSTDIVHNHDTEIGQQLQGAS